MGTGVKNRGEEIKWTMKGMRRRRKGKRAAKRIRGGVEIQME